MLSDLAVLAMLFNLFHTLAAKRQNEYEPWVLVILNAGKWTPKQTQRDKTSIEVKGFDLCQSGHFTFTVKVYCQGNLANMPGVRCNGLAFHPQRLENTPGCLMLRTGIHGQWETFQEFSCGIY